MEAQARAEVERLYRFMARWIVGQGTSCDEIFAGEFCDQLSPDYSMTLPGGGTLERGQMIGVVRHVWATNPSFDIEIHDLVPRVLGPHAVLVTYRTRLINARFSDRPGSERIGSALLARQLERINELAWVHIHLTFAD